MKKTLISSAVILVFSMLSFAADIQVLTGSDISGRYLGIDIGARSAGMGNAIVTLSKGAEAIFGNPANSTQPDNRNSFLISHNSWLADTFQETAAYAIGLKGLGTFGIGISYMNEGNIEAYQSDPSGNNPVKIPDINPYVMLVKVNWSGAVLKELQVGINLDHSTEKIGSSTNQSIGVDLGVRYKPDALKGISFGVVARNIGRDMAGYDLYRDLLMGAGYELNMKQSGNLNLGADFGMLYDGHFKISEKYKASIGAEYVYAGMYMARIGYELDNTESDGLTGLRAGLGLKLDIFSIDYAFEPYGNVGVSNKISMGLNF